MQLLIIPPKYRLTKKITQLLSRLEANKAVIEAAHVPVALEENIRRKSLLGSALFSARIEGNPLTQQVISSGNLSSRDQKRLEVANLERAIAHVIGRHQNQKKKITIRDVLVWHRLVMKNLLAPEFLGRFRSSHEGVFDTGGNVIYHSPPPKFVPELIERAVNYLNSNREKLLPIKAILGHLILEKIHPFVDGSGRVGRLLQLAVLVREGYGMKGLVSVEEEIDNHRSLYYQAIEAARGSDSTEFVELMLEFLVTASGKASETLSQAKTPEQDGLLPPRRQEMLAIIADHQFVSLDFLARRFRAISPRLLRYDLKKLMDQSYVRKIGRTKGALYTIRD